MNHIIEVNAKGFKTLAQMKMVGDTYKVFCYLLVDLNMTQYKRVIMKDIGIVTGMEPSVIPCALDELMDNKIIEQDPTDKYRYKLLFNPFRVV